MIVNENTMLNGVFGLFAGFKKSLTEVVKEVLKKSIPDLEG